MWKLALEMSITNILRFNRYIKGISRYPMAMRVLFCSYETLSFDHLKVHKGENFIFHCS